MELDFSLSSASDIIYEAMHSLVPIAVSLTTWFSIVGIAHAQIGYESEYGSLNPFAGEAAKQLQCSTVPAFPENNHARGLTVNQCKILDPIDSNGINLEIKHTALTKPVTRLDKETGQIIMEPSKSISLGMSVTGPDYMRLAHMPCSKGVIISYIYNAPDTTDVAHTYIKYIDGTEMTLPWTGPLTTGMEISMCQSAEA